MTKQIQTVDLVKEIMQAGFDVSMGGDPFKTGEENEKILNEQFDEMVEKYTEKIIQSQQEAVEREHQNFRIAIKQIIGTNAVFLLPSHTEMVEGFWNNKEYRVKGIDVTKEIVNALQGGQDDQTN